MSSSEKRILPTSSTAALVPISEVSFNERTYSRTNPNDELIDQLVGGLIQADHPADDTSRFSGQSGDYGAHERTYSIDDEEIDEAPVPIPSTWREPQNHQEPNWFMEQARASAYGFAVGLFVVIPAVMLLTGQTERLPSWQALVSYAQVSDSGTGLTDQSGYGEVAPTQSVKPTASPSATTDRPAVETATRTQATAVTAPATQDEGAQSPAAPAETSVATAAERPDAETSPSTESLSEPAAATVAPGREENTQAAPTGPAVEPPAASENRTDVAAAAALRDEPPPAAPKATVVAAAPIVTTEPSVKTSTTPTAAAPATTTPPASEETPVQTPAPITAAQPPKQPEAANSPEPANDPSSETKTAAVAPSEQNTTAQADSVAANPVTLDKARETIKAGDMDGARVMLARLASQGNSDAIFALAETFDPNVLAAWGTHGEEADSDKARMFYSMALARGVNRAAGRLQALQE